MKSILPFMIRGLIGCTPPAPDTTQALDFVFNESVARVTLAAYVAPVFSNQPIFDEIVGKTGSHAAAITALPDGELLAAGTYTAGRENWTARRSAEFADEPKTWQPLASLPSPPADVCLIGHSTVCRGQIADTAQKPWAGLPMALLTGWQTGATAAGTPQRGAHRSVAGGRDARTTHFVCVVGGAATISLTAMPRRNNRPAQALHRWRRSALAREFGDNRWNCRRRICNLRD